MTDSNHNLSNFEANFIKYLQNSNFSRTLRKPIITFFKDYCSFLKLKYPAEDYGNYSRLFTARTLSAYKPYFHKKTKSQSRWSYFMESLSSYRTYLERHKNIYVSISEDNNRYQELLDGFIGYLRKKSFSDSTVKNYKADLKQFIEFIGLREISLENIADEKIQLEYSAYLADKHKLATESIKRKLSTVNSFYGWLKRISILKSVITHKISETKPKTVTETISTGKTTEDAILPPAIFGNSQISKLFYPALLIILSVSLSIGIYQQFFDKVPTPQAFPAIPKSPSRILSFQGRLTDASGVPIVEKVDVRFKLWNQASGGLELYDSGFCALSPDQNGIFYTIIGSTCGREIASSVFTENTLTFLGITVSGDSEMSPRQQIASVGYSLNSESLQGIPPGSPAGLSTIPYINKDGHLLIGAENPVIKSTSGLFKLEGNSLTLAGSEGSNGNINLSPDGNGSINLIPEGFFPATGSGLVNLSAVNVISGSVLQINGSTLTAGYKLLELTSGNPASQKFSVDAAGNTVLAGSLSVGNSFQSSASGTLVNSNLNIQGLITDGGLGIFGSLGSRIPSSIDFTKDKVIEFNFKVGTTKVEVHANINDDGSKFYAFTWDTDGKINIDKCTPVCSNLVSDSLSWSNDSWHDGFISFSGTNLKWSIDKGGKTVNASVGTDVPTISNGYLMFSSGFSAINNLVISPTTDLVLTAGHAYIGGRLAIDDNFTTSGRIGIGTTDPGEKLDVEGNVEIDASGTSYTQRLCHSGSDGETNDLKLGDCAASDQADIAEYYGSDGKVMPGEIVRAIYARDHKAFVSASTERYQNSIIGIVSSNPHPEILSDSVFNEDEFPVPIALIGRVPLKASSENGDIKIGDLLTSSSLRGFGMKATSSGQVIAKALQNFEDSAKIPCPTDSPAGLRCAEILVFVNLSWYEKPLNSEDLARYEIVLKPESSNLQFLDLLNSNLAEIRSTLNSFTSNYIKTDLLNAVVIEADEVKTGNLEVGLISPLSEDETIEIEGSVKVFGELNSASISAEVAEIAGTLKADKVETGSLDVVDGTVSGTLYADKIVGKEINDLKTSFGTMMDRLNSLPTPTISIDITPVLTATPSPTLTATPALITPTLSGTPTPEPVLENDTATESAGIYSTEELEKLIQDADGNTGNLLSINEKISAFLDTNPINPINSDLSEDSLVDITHDVKFTGNTSLANTSVSGQLMVDGILIMENDKLQSLTDTLYLNSSEFIDFMGGQMIVDSGGNLNVKGQIIAQNGIKTSEITSNGNGLTIDLKNQDSASASNRIGGQSAEEAGFGELLVRGNTEIEGELSAWKIRLNEPAASTSAEKILTAAENFLTHELNAPGMITGKTAGSAVLPAGYQEFVIYNDSLTKDSLIYLTTTSNTQNRTLYIARKDICKENPGAKCKPYFSVALDSPYTEEISFNWWFVN